MSGVAIVRALLAAHAPLLAIVPAERIFSGPIPQGTALPAVGVTTAASAEIRATTRNASSRTNRERVQVTVQTRDPLGYATQKRAIQAAALGRGLHTGIVLGYNVKAVEPYGVNPDILPDESKIYEQSRDFMVTFSEPN
jgi:hypothetical protein